MGDQSGAPMRMRAAAGASEKGAGRTLNEDAILVRPDEGLLAVADGMGGPGAGDVAARIAVNRLETALPAVARTLHENRDSLATSGARLLASAALEHALHGVHDAIGAEADRLGKRWMAASAVALVVREGLATIAHVGDCRAYLLHHGELRALTDDHTVAMLRLRQGRMTGEEYAKSPLRNRLIQVLGAGAHLDVDLAEVEVAGGDRLLLCSDGIHDTLDAPTIARELAADAPPAAIAAGLVHMARAAGNDDASAVVAMIEGEARTDELDSIARVMRDAFLFRTLNEAERQLVAPYLDKISLDAGEILFAEGDTGDAFYVVIRGALAITKGKLTLREIGAGGHLGELCLTRPVPRSATVTANVGTELFGLTRGRFQELLRRRQNIGAKLTFQLLDRLGDQLRDLSERLASIEALAGGSKTTPGGMTLREAVLAAGRGQLKA